MGMYGNVWECMGMYGNVWECMGMYESVWECMGVYGRRHPPTPEAMEDKPAARTPAQ